MKRIPLIVLALVVFASTGMAQRAEQIVYRDSIDGSQNTATATSSAAGFESYIYLRDDFKYYTDHSVFVKFTKVTDSVKFQVAYTNFGEDTTWVDMYLPRLKSTKWPSAPGWTVQRDTLVTWVTDVGFDAGYTHGPFAIDHKYVGRRWRVVTGVLDTGKIYVNQAYKTPQ